MRNHPRPISSLLTFVSLCCLLHLIESSVRAEVRREDDPTVHLSSAQAHIFRDALATLAAQARVSFVVEGVPLHPILSTRNASPVPDAGAPLSRAVDALAARYDYAVLRHGRVFELTKRYSDPNDLPGVTLKEWGHTLEDIQRITDQFNPHVPSVSFSQGRNPLLGDLVASLTASQVAAMQEKTPDKGLTVSSLGPQQRALVQRLALYFYVQRPLDGAQIAIMDLREASKFGASVVFRKGDLIALLHLTGPPAQGLGGLQVFGYETPVESVGHSSFRPLSSPGGRVAYNGNVIMIAHYPPGTINPPHQDSTDPMPILPHLLTVPGVVAATEGAGPTPSSIASVIATLNSSLGQNRSLTVADDVQNKPIIVVGFENASPADILQAMADVYGLRVTRKKDGVRLLERNQFAVPTDVSGLPDALRRVFPSPFLRALHLDLRESREEQYRLLVAQSWALQGTQTPEDGAAGQGGSQQNQQAVEARPSDRQQQSAASEAMRKLIHNRIEERDRIRAYLPALRAAAVRQLRTHVEPLLSQAKDGLVPLSSVSEADQQAFAIALIAPCLESLTPLLNRQVPDYITDYDQLYLMGGPEKDRNGANFFGVFLALPSPDGSRLEQGVGSGINLSIHPL